MTLLLPSTWAARMRPAPAYAGSMARYRDARRTSDPFRRAFSLGQDGSIEALRSCILLVATRSRTEELFAGVRVSGVDPLSTNLVSFASRDGCIVGSGLPGIVVVVPSLSAVRSFLGAGSTAAAVLVDGMRRLLAGRADRALQGPLLLRGAQPGRRGRPDRDDVGPDQALSRATS